MRNVPRVGGEYDKNRVHTGDECSRNGTKGRKGIKEKMSETDRQMLWARREM